MLPLELINPTIAKFDGITQNIQHIPQSLCLCNDEWSGDQLQLCLMAVNPELQGCFKLRESDPSGAMSCSLGTTSHNLCSDMFLILHPL